MSLYERVADLPLSVGAVELVRHERETSRDFTRVSTEIHLWGDGAVGRGEDVSYDAADHEALQADPPELPIGEHTLRAYSAAVADVDLFPEPPERETARRYRRWAVESAALDLALRQAGTNLGSVLDRPYEPVWFVPSTRLGDAGFDRIEAMLAANPDLEFKLDPTPEWDDGLLERLADTGRVRVLDLKGYYEGTDVDAEPDPDLYERVLAAFPDAIVEDAVVTDATETVLGGHEDRLAWDYPFTGVDAIADLPVEPAVLNVKPSRFGTVRSLLTFLEHCEREGIRLYGGGQYELDVGREHLHAIASLFYADATNDVAPAGYNDADLSDDLPRSPLEPTASRPASASKTPTLRRCRCRRGRGTPPGRRRPRPSPRSRRTARAARRSARGTSRPT